MPTDPIASLRAEWSRRCRAAGSAELLSELVAVEPDLSALGATSLDGLFATLDPRFGLPASTRLLASAALVRCAGLDELVALGLLARAVPGLIAVGRQLRWGGDGPWTDASEFTADLVSEAWIGLFSMAGQSFGYPERELLRRVRRRLDYAIYSHRRRTRREASAEEASLSVLGDRQGGWPQQPRRASTLEDLAVALTTPGASREDRRGLRLVFQTRVLGYSIDELVASGAGARRSLYACREKTEAALCA